MKHIEGLLEAFCPPVCGQNVFLRFPVAAFSALW